MRLIGQRKEELLVGKTSELSLDELFEMANEIGELETGGIMGSHSAEIKLRNIGGDFIIVKSRKYRTLKENIQECISRSRQIINFYRTL